MTQFGFIAECLPLSRHWVISPATQDSGKVTAHDLSGFMGSWEVRNLYEWFPSETDNATCPVAMKKAQDYCDKMNGKEV